MTYASVNELNMYYERHGEGRPLVLIHGGMSAIGTSFGPLLPGLATDHQVIAVEMQAHGHTADIDRPLRYPDLAEDVAALLAHLGVDDADVMGYSVGAGVATELVLRHPDLVGRLVLVSAAYRPDGLHPGLLDGIDQMKAEDMVGSPFHDEYLRIAPRPDDFPVTVERVKDLDRTFTGWTAEQVSGIDAPVLLVYGDSDIVTPEHAVELFRLLGGGVIGDVAGLPNAQLAVLPGTTHLTLVERAEWLLSMMGEFLDKQEG